MAGTKISALTAGAALGGTEALPAVQTAATVKITAAQIKTFTLGLASALSAPAVPVVGTWITGGSATTTKPHALIEPAGTTSTGWSTGGTGLGVNAASGFAGNLIDLQVAGVRKFNVDSAGNVAIPGGAKISLLAGSGLIDLLAGTSSTSALSIGYDGSRYSFQLGSASSVLWTNGSTVVQGGTVDTGLSRISAGVIGVGTGTQGATDGTIRAANLNLRDNNAQITFGSSYDLILTRAGAATLRHGAADAASPVAQTIKFQDVVAGTSNTAGVNATIQAPAGTGTGAGGALFFQVAPAGSSGTAKNAWTTALTITSSGNATFAGDIVLRDAFFNRDIGALRHITGQTGYTEQVEMAAPAAPAANRVRLYAEDNGSGKTRLMALFATGAAQQVAIEP